MLAVLLVLAACAAQAEVPVEIAVTDSLTRSGLGGVEVQAQPQPAERRPASRPLTTTTTESGRASLALTPGRWRLHLRRGGYRAATRWVEVRGEAVRLSMALEPVPFLLPETTAFALREPEEPGRTSMAPSEVRGYPSPSPDPLRLVRVLPGVASGGDQGASAYSVRGGSFDENLVYVEGVELDAPLLLRHGLAETLSPVNADLVAEARFRAGVLPVDLGDRLASALEVEYRRPDAPTGEAAASALRQSVAVGSRTGQIAWMVGARRADLSRLARNLQTSGDFTPQFCDVQGLATWEGEGGSATLFALSADSEFRLSPQRVRLTYDCIDPRVAAAQGLPGAGCKVLSGGETGKQVFRYRVDAAGVRARQEWGEYRLRGGVAAQRRTESEATDLRTDLDWTGWGGAHVSGWLRADEEYAGDLEVTRWEGSMAVAPVGDAPAWEVGGGLRRTALEATRLGQEVLRLAGETVTLRDLDDRTSRQPVDVFAYGRRAWTQGPLNREVAARVARFGGPGEVVVLPRARLTYAASRWRLSAATGLAAQPPLYREGLDARTLPRSQKGAEAVLELTCQAERLRWRATGFYRHLWDQVSFTVDDVEVRYSGHNDSRARVLGADAMARGQIGAAVGTVSYTWLKARENLEGDGAGWVPRATDQRHTVAVYLEDCMDLRVTWMRASRFHIRVLYGSGFPFTQMVPERDAEGTVLGLEPGRRNSVRASGYFRIDIGMTQVFGIGGVEVEVREEVANYFDELNAVGYRQLPAPDGKMSLLARGQGRRVFNGEVRVRF